MAKARTQAERAAYRFTPLGMSRLDAAEYVGVSPSMFDLMVKDERMPKPRKAGARVLWDRDELTAYFRALRRDGEETVPGNSFSDWQ